MNWRQLINAQVSQWYNTVLKPLDIQRDSLVGRETLPPERRGAAFETRIVRPTETKVFAPVPKKQCTIHDINITYSYSGPISGVLLYISKTDFENAIAQMSGDPTFCPLQQHNGLFNGVTFDGAGCWNTPSGTIDVPESGTYTGLTTGCQSSGNPCCFAFTSYTNYSYSGGASDSYCPNGSDAWGVTGTITESVDFGNVYCTGPNYADAAGFLLPYSYSASANWSCSRLCPSYQCNIGDFCEPSGELCPTVCDDGTPCSETDPCSDGSECTTGTCSGSSDSTGGPICCNFLSLGEPGSPPPGATSSILVNGVQGTGWSANSDSNMVMWQNPLYPSDPTTCGQGSFDDGFV